MISKEERDKDRAICEAATRDWRQGHHVGEPKAICAAATPDESLLMLDKDGMAIFWREVDARAAVNAVNRLPAYIADAEEMERRVEALVEALPKCRVDMLDTTFGAALRSTRCARPATHEAYDYRCEVGLCDKHAEQVRDHIALGEVIGPMAHAEPLGALFRILRGEP